VSLAYKKKVLADFFREQVADGASTSCYKL